MLNRLRSTTFLAAALCVCASFACKVKELTAPVAEAEHIKPTPTPALTEPITIAAVGDIMLGSTSINDTFLPPSDGRDMLVAFTPVLSQADIAFGNLEGPLIDGGVGEKCPPPKPVKPGEPSKPVRCFAFRSPTRYGRHLKDAGFDIMSVANNHASDFGEAGRNSTRRVLDSLGIKHAGGNRASLAVSMIEIKGRRIAFIGFAHNPISPNINELEPARQLVAATAKKADIVVVSFHGGAEGEKAQNVPKRTELFAGEKRGNLPLFARTVIDAGADLVLGHGPHVLRGMEVYKDRLVVYSMGNFATYGMFNLKGPQGLTAVFEITLNAEGTFAGGKIHSGKQEGRGIPVADPSGEAVRKIRSLSRADFGTAAPNIADDGTISPK